MEQKHLCHYHWPNSIYQTTTLRHSVRHPLIWPQSVLHPLIWPQSGKRMLSFQDISLFSSCQLLVHRRTRCLCKGTPLCTDTKRQRLFPYPWVSRQRHYTLAESCSSFKDMPESPKEETAKIQRMRERLIPGPGFG